ncbi:MAG: sugar transferase [Ignavibacteria bacterium]|nr:sugar transferase [Ignavibacteria bacterium]
MHQSEAQSTAVSDIKVVPESAFSKKKDINKVAANLLLYLLIYVGFYFINKKGWVFDSRYLLFLPVFVSAWGIGGLLSAKFKIKPDHEFIARAKRCASSLLISLGVVAIALLELDLSISRFVVVGSLTTAAFIETILEFYRSGSKIDFQLIRNEKISYALLVLDLFILSAVLFFFYEARIGFKELNNKHVLLLAATFVSWLFASMISHQFRPFREKFNFWKAVGNQVKAYLLLIALTSFNVYILLMPEYYASVYLTSVVLYSVWSFAVVMFIYIDKLPEKTDEIRSDFLHAYELKIPKIKTLGQREEFRYKFNGIKNNDNSELRTKLELLYFKEFPDIFDFIERKIDLSSFHINRSVVLRSRDPYNVIVNPENEVELFINLHKLNDVRRINNYFIELNKRLVDGGIFVGNFEPVRFRYKRFLEKYPFLVAHFFYLIDFIWHRIAPKLPVIRKLFFAINKGKDRAISLAEGLGRLYYCGFEVMDLKSLDNICYFVAKKVKEPSTDKNPSYSPVFKMRRFGKNGKLIFVYKLRTMHPYSEYLQEFIYEQNALEEGGKFKDDFRISPWGKVLRKLWIDELPMMFNLFRGDCKLIGVRPLSNHYLSLYDEQHRARRLQYKPGLIPPYYADMPKTVSEIIKSEEAYLNQFDKNRFNADIKYFFKAVNNILLNQKRSS